MRRTAARGGFVIDVRKAAAGALIVLAAAVGAASAGAPASTSKAGPSSSRSVETAPRTQNWTPDAIEQWYNGTQGSRLALEERPGQQGALGRLHLRGLPHRGDCL